MCIHHIAIDVILKMKPSASMTIGGARDV